MSYPLPTLTNDFYQTLKPLVMIGKKTSYITIPAFEVTYLLKTAPYIFAVFQYAATKDFVLTRVDKQPSPQSDLNYILCVKYRDEDGTVHRYKLWWSRENDVLEYIPRYEGQKIKKYFTLELWSRDTTVSTLPIPGETQIFYNDEQICTTSMDSVQAGTVWSFLSQEDADNIALANLFCPPQPDPPDPDPAFSPELSGLRFEIPCGACVSGDGNGCFLCLANDPIDQTVTLVANPAKTYNILLGFIGFIEFSTAIVNGSQGDATSAHFRLGAQLTGDSQGYNAYSLVMSDPSNTAYLNKVITTSAPTLVNYTATIQMKGNSTLRLHAITRDGRQLANHDNVVVPGVAPAPLPYNGQFLQINVLQITEAP